MSPEGQPAGTRSCSRQGKSGGRGLQGKEPGTFRGRQRGQQGLEQRPETLPPAGAPGARGPAGNPPAQLSPFASTPPATATFPGQVETPPSLVPDHAGWAEGAPQASGLLS